MDDTVNLGVFVAEVRLQADLFEQWWHENHRSNPEDFPLSLSAQDWHEQFMVWSALQE